MKKYFYFIGFLALLSQGCSQEEASIASDFSAVSQVLNTAESDAPFEGDFAFFKDISYGSKPNNKLDILLPKGKTIKGALLYFHGGAFLFGTKEDLYESPSQEFMRTLLEEGIAIVNAAYTFIDDAESEGVMTALEEGTAVIRFVEQKASVLGIPPNQLVLAGISAGAGIAQWNGFRQESNSAVKGIVATLAQSSYDLYEWEQLFPDFSVDNLRTQNEALESVFDEFFDGEATAEKRAALEYRSFMDAEDPPLYVYNPVYEDSIFDTQDSLDFNVLFHSVKHADYLRQKALEVGLAFSGAYKESPESFVLRVLANESYNLN